MLFGLCIKNAFMGYVKTVTNWSEEIFTYFNKRLTNAYLKIKYLRKKRQPLMGCPFNY